MIPRISRMREKNLLVNRPLRRKQNNSSRLLHRQHELDVRPILATLPNQRRSIVESAYQIRAARRHGPAILCLVPGHEVRPVDLQHDGMSVRGGRYGCVVGEEVGFAQWRSAGCSLFEASFGHLSGGRLTYPTSMTEGMLVKVLWGAQRTEKYSSDPHRHLLSRA